MLTQKSIKKTKKTKKQEIDSSRAEGIQLSGRLLVWLLWGPSSVPSITKRNHIHRWVTLVGGTVLVKQARLQEDKQQIVKAVYNPDVWTLYWIRTGK